MVKIYDILFNKIYAWNLRKWGVGDIPHWNATLGVSFIMFINLISIALLFELAGVNIFLQQNIDKSIIALLALLIFSFNYFRYLHNQKFKRIVQMHKQEGLGSIIKGKYYMTIIVTFSLIILIVLALLNSAIHE